MLSTNMGEELKKDLFNEIKDVYSAFYNRADDNVKPSY
jgi:hypothetical protein